MKTLALSLIVLLVGVGFSAGSSQHSPAKDCVHMDWLLERIDEVKSILITHKCQPQLTGDRATEESAQRHERVEEPDQRVGSGG